MIKPLLLAMLFFMVGCTHSIHLVHVSDFVPEVGSAQKGKLITSMGKQFTIMGITGNTRYVEKALKKLVEQCPNGEVQGILTRFSTDHGFFSWTNRVVMEGRCLEKES